jgi:hypothetical protein
MDKGGALEVELCEGNLEVGAPILETLKVM